MLESSATIVPPTLSEASSSPTAVVASSATTPVAVSATDLSAWIMTPLESLKTGALFRVSRCTAALPASMALSAMSVPAASRYVAVAVRTPPMSPAFGV